MIAPKTVHTKIAQKRRETADCVTLKLDLGGEAFEYKPGMAVNLDPHQFPALAGRIRELEEKKGQPEMDRSFSLSSNPLEAGFVEITVKEERGGLVTPHFVREIEEGDPVTIAGPFGLFTLPDAIDPSIDCFLYVAAGSGITPSRGIWRFCLAKGLPVKHSIFFQNRTIEDVIYRAELEELARSPKAKVVHVLSKQQGYLTLDVLSQGLAGFADPARCLAFVCGPNKPRDGRPGFVDAFAGVKRKNQLGILGQLGIPFERIKTELW